MGPPSYVRSVVDRNVVMRHMTVESIPCVVLHWISIVCFVYQIMFITKPSSTVPIFSFIFQQPLVGQDLLIIEASRSHSVGLPWTSDHPDAETSTWHNTTITRDVPGGIRTRNPSMRVVLDCAASGIGSTVSIVLVNLVYLYKGQFDG
jgi:hypothetical protein